MTMPISRTMAKSHRPAPISSRSILARQRSSSMRVAR
jgi:hypothetical protein